MDDRLQSLVAISGKEVFDVIRAIAPITERFPPGHVMMAGLTLAVIMQDPELTPEELHDILLGASQYIVTAIRMVNDTVPTEEIPKNLLN